MILSNRQAKNPPINGAVDSTPVAPNVQHLNSPKKCCTLGTLLHIGDIALEK